MRIKSTILFCWLCLVSTGLSQSVTGSAAFLNRGVSARAIALGGAQTAAVDDASAVYWNPARLLATTGFSLIVSDIVDIQSSLNKFDVNYPQIAMSVSSKRPILGNSRIGLGFGYAGFLVKDISRYDENANYLGSMSYNEYVLFFSMAFSMRFLHLGVTWKHINQSFSGDMAYQQSTKQKVRGPDDIGLHYKPLRYLSLALIVRDSIAVGDYDKTGRNAQVGATFIGSAVASWLPLITIDLSSEPGSRYWSHFGVEYPIAVGERQILLRGGYSKALLTDEITRPIATAEMKGSIGVGLKFDWFIIDLGWTQELAPSLFSPYSGQFVMTMKFAP